MARYFFAVIVLIHGLIHLMGFINQWNLKKITQFTGNTLFPVSENLSKLFGVPESDLLPIWLADKVLQLVEKEKYSIEALEITLKKVKDK